MVPIHSRVRCVSRIGMGYQTRPDIRPLHNRILVGDCVTELKKIPAGSLVVGAPGKVARETTQAERDSNRAMARKYMKIKDTFRGTGEYSV